MEAPGVYDDWTGNIVNGADVRSLDIGAIRSARAAFRERFPDRAEESQGWDDATFLSRTGVFKRGKVTVAALILLGKQDAGLLPPSVCIRWRLLDPDGALQDSRTFGGPMLLSSSQAVSMVRNWTCTVGSGDGARQVSAYRNSALIEAVRNAVAHQDYALGGTVDVVERESESVTVVSRGSFPQRAPESFISGPPQARPPRNAFLVSAMAGIGMVPASGTGIRSMYMAQASRRFPMPDFDVSDDRVAVRFPGIRGGAYARVLDMREDVDLRAMMDLDRLAKLRFVPERRVRALARRGLVEVMDGVPCIACGAGQEVLSAFVTGTEEDAVLSLIDRNGSVARSDVAELLAARDPRELSQEQVRVRATNLLQSMRRRGLVEKADGSTRSARYVRGPPGDSARCPAVRCEVFYSIRILEHSVSSNARARSVFATVAMLLLACVPLAAPAVSAGEEEAEDESETVVIVSDRDGDLGLSETVMEYAKISAMKEHYESHGREVIVIDGAHESRERAQNEAVDEMRRMIGPESFAPAAEPEPGEAGGEGRASGEGSEGDAPEEEASEEDVSAEDASDEAESVTEAASTVTVVTTEESTIAPDMGFVEEVQVYLLAQGYGDAADELGRILADWRNHSAAALCEYVRASASGQRSDRRDDPEAEEAEDDADILFDEGDGEDAETISETCVGPDSEGPCGIAASETGTTVRTTVCASCSGDGPEF